MKRIESSPIQKHWNDLYKNQDSVKKFTWSEKPSEFILDSIDRIKKQNYEKVLDLGCGDCRDLMPFAFAGLDCTGLDISQEGMKRAMRSFESVGLSPEELIIMDLNNLTLRKKYDLIISAKVFKHLWNTEKIVSDIRKNLRKNGLVIFEFASTRDSSHKKCRQDGERKSSDCYKYLHKSGTTYRFHSRNELKKIFSEYTNVKIRRYQYWDEPHNVLSVGPHKHISWVVFANK